MLTISSRLEAEQAIRSGWQVLDVGSGDYPFPQATVLVDHLPKECHTEAGRRTENPTARIVRHGKRFTTGDLEALPFRDRSFDFVYASHVLEHAVDAGRAISELERVAPRGYIECPRAWYEFVDGSPFHRWLIDFAGGELQFRPKTEVECSFSEARRLFDAAPDLFVRFYGQVFNHPRGYDPTGTSLVKSICHVCVYWEGAIPYRILPAHTYRT
jgi:hypothetical protein